ncbi:MAG TPA: SCO family protein [Longimicrobiales bacterium]|nr:SCO family protein [Longimicrobiales bacterium]
MRPPTILLLATALALASCAQPPADAPGSASLGLLGTEPVAPLEKVSFTFPDVRGEPWDFRAETDGRITLLYFGYTFCPDICSVQMATLAAALREVPPDVRAAVTTVFVTVDPARDTPERLAGWLGAFDSSFVGLRPTPETLAEALAFYRYPPPESSGEDEGYTMSHPAMVYAFTPDDLGRAMYGADTPKAAWAHDLVLLAGRDWSGGEALPRAPGGDLMAQVGGIQVLDAVVPRPPTATTTAFYATLHNAGSEADTLLGISTPAAERAMLHDMVLEGGVMRMTHLMGGIPLPPGATVRLEPGSRHGMLEGLSGLPEPGGTVSVVLRFALAGETPVPARVVRYEDLGRR